MKKVSLLLSMVAVLQLTIFSQDIKPCSTDDFVKKMILEDPRIIEVQNRLENFTKAYIEENMNKTEKTTYVIPIVFHIVHDYGPENLSKATLEAAVEQMNKDYTATNEDISNVVDAFTGIIGDAIIEFRLAKLDPDGNCTEGITRTYSLNTYAGGEETKAIAPGWDRSMYLNVWVVNKIASGAAGYSYYPSSVEYQSAKDGIVVLYDYVGVSNTRRHTLSHEAGHWLNLAHPWGSTNEPGLASNCSSDDQVEDTPNTIGWTTCNLNGFSCQSLDNVQNIMEYSYCTNMFTQGQVARMHAALNSSISGRSNLSTTANLIATGTNDGYNGQPCAPIAEFLVDKEQVCANSDITFSDFSYNSEVADWLWAFEGGNPETSTEQNPVVNYINGGKFNVTLTASNDYGSNTIVKEGFVNIVDTYSGYSLPMSEDFENAQFPLNTDDSTKNWTIEANSAETWKYTSSASVSGQGSVRIKNQSIASQTINSLISPNINLRGFTPESITFKLAYANTSSTSSAELNVYISKNCGVSWQLVYAKSGSQLVSNDGTYITSDFIPEPNEWKDQSIGATSFLSNDNILIKFVNKSFGGNYLYIDDIAINKVVGVEELNFNQIISDLNIHPNPFTNDAIISYSLNSPTLVSIEVYDMVGKNMGNYSALQLTGNHEISLNEITSVIDNGIYMLKLKAGNKSTTRRIIKF